MSYHQPDAASATLAGFCLPARRLHRESARPAGGFWRSMPTPSLPPKRALAPPPRLRAKRTYYCALLKNGQSRASSAAGGRFYRQKNCANLCMLLHYEGVIYVVTAFHLRVKSNFGDQVMISSGTITIVQKAAKPLFSIVKAVGPFILSQSKTAVENYSDYKLNKARLEALSVALQEEAKHLSEDRAKLREVIRDSNGIDRVKAQNDYDLINKELNKLSTIARVKDFFSQEEEVTNNVEMEDSWIDKFNSLASSLNEEWRKSLLANAFALELKEPGSINILTLNAIASFDEDSFKAFGILIDSSVRLNEINIIPLDPFTGKFSVSGGFEDGDELMQMLTHLNLVNISGGSYLKIARRVLFLRYGRQVLELEYAIDSEVIPSISHIRVLTFTALGNAISKLYSRKITDEGKVNFESLKIAANMKGYHFKESILSEEEYARLGN
ncbi:hypothetical protein LHK99_18795 [Klebsiella quasipneumoniae]|uniref:hypothetical protein n=1 Tax=Klebsiella quasipneumoniae TaxID=1463165 RepID=UPI001CFB63F3|nr:hypothetical protein [Klebsiella quasipneumoniae]MCB4712750.1 hypothetical protein [Klebsiella quasipneumoniae]MDI3159050.1 hypothetical protein [Klebsiella quasipneumoniae]